MRAAAALVNILGVLFVAGCATSKMTVTQPSDLPDHPISRVAIAPGSGVMGDAIALELFNRGLTVIDANEAGAIVGRAGLGEFEITTTQGLAALREKGIEAVLTAKSVDAQDGTPESASVRVSDTSTGEVIAGINWQNGWGGQRGSIADRTMRKNLAQAAHQIADELAERLNLHP